MSKRFICICLLAMASAVSPATLFAQEGTPKAALGTLMLSNKKYPLKHALAYETSSDGKEAIAIVLSGQVVSNEELKAAREAEKEGGDAEFKKPYLQLVFKKSGELRYWSGKGGGAMVGHRTGTGTGEFKLQDGRVIGKASQPDDTEGIIPTGFDVHFKTALLKAGDSLPESTVRKGGPVANVKPTVTGVFKGNGKEAKLAYVSARWTEPFSEKAAIMLIFTEKDHSKDPKPDFDAAFGKYGCALVISLHEDGTIFSCEVAHSAHQKKQFSSVGSIEAPDFTYGDGKVEGEITTNGQLEFFGDTWEVNLHFVAPLGEIPKELQPAAAKKEEKPASNSDDESALSTSRDEGDDSATKRAAPGPKAQDLALTKDASDVEYKALVQQIAFQSKAEVKKTSAELSANLAAQGWTKTGQDLITPQSAILKRKRGGAELTIFVKPASGGSEVKIMSEGLSWD